MMGALRSGPTVSAAQEKKTGRADGPLGGIWPIRLMKGKMRERGPAPGLPPFLLYFPSCLPFPYFNFQISSLSLNSFQPLIFQVFQLSAQLKKIQHDA